MDSDRPHACERCGARFKRKDALKRHGRRKTPCVRVSDAPPARRFVCDACGRAFDHKGVHTRHRMYYCRLARAAKQSAVHDLQKENARLREELEATRAEMMQRMSRLEERGAPGGHTVNQGVVNNGVVNAGVVNAGVVNNNSVAVHLNVWGGEAVDHLTHRRMRTIVGEATRRLGGAAADAKRLVRAVLSEVARAIYLERPENHVAYLPNVKEDRARVLTKHGWEERSGTEVVEAMHEKAKDEASRKQPMETMADVALMDPVLKTMNAVRVPRAELRALLTNMRPRPAGDQKHGGLAAHIIAMEGGAGHGD